MVILPRGGTKDQYGSILMAEIDIQVKAKNEKKLIWRANFKYYPSGLKDDSKRLAKDITDKLKEDGLFNESQAAQSQQTTSEIELVSKGAALFNSQGLEHMKNKEYDKAISDFSSAIIKNPLYVHAYHNRGIAYNRKGQFELALSDFITAIEINPDIYYV